MELCSGSTWEGCISARPQANEYKRTLNYASAQRVSETTSTSVVPE